MKIPQNLPRFSDYTREEALRLLLEKEYGCPPPQPDTLEFHVVRREEDAFAGKAVHATVEAWVTFQGRGFSFPFHLVCPKAGQPAPGVVLLNFTPAVPDPYLPSEELCDLGLAVASFHCGDVSPDNGDFTSKAGGLFQVDRSLPTAPGKLALWAWGASVVREYLAACPEIDQKAVAVAGHSRLGKTALLAGALDKRFQFVFANESGCSGAALYRGKQGETAADIQRVFPHWFSPSFASCTGDPEQLPFDQHFLLSLIAPRNAVRLQRGGRPLVRPRRGVFGLPGGVSRLRGGRRPRSCGSGGGAPAGPGLPPGEHRLPPAGGQAFPQPGGLAPVRGVSVPPPGKIKGPLAKAPQTWYDNRVTAGRRCCPGCERDH